MLNGVIKRRAGFTGDAMKLKTTYCIPAWSRPSSMTFAQKGFRGRPPCHRPRPMCPRCSRQSRPRYERITLPKRYASNCCVAPFQREISSLARFDRRRHQGRQSLDKLFGCPHCKEKLLVFLRLALPRSRCRPCRRTRSQRVIRFCWRNTKHPSS